MKGFSPLKLEIFLYERRLQSKLRADADAPFPLLECLINSLMLAVFPVTSKSTLLKAGSEPLLAVRLIGETFPELEVLRFAVPILYSTP